MLDNDNSLLRLIQENKHLASKNMKFTIVVLSLVVLVVVGAEERRRTVPSYRGTSPSYDQSYETTTYAVPTYSPSSYKPTETYDNEPVYRKSSYPTTTRPSYTTPTPYEEPKYSTLTATYATETKYTRPTYETTESYSATTNAPYSAPAYGKQESYDYKPMPYKFAWGVKDEASYNDYSHQQESDGNVVTGSYRVLLPDGRTQIVTYKADSNGYVADVKYEGEVKYQEYKPAYSTSAKY